MQTQVNKPLQDLLQTAQFVTPSGGDTVAAKYVQAAQQKMQAQAVPPGIAALLPGVQQQAAQAAQAAQPATQGDVNQLRQMLAQAQQGQGVAQLPGSDVEVAEGGIVGYNGQTGSLVKTQAEEDREKLAGILQYIKQKGLLPAGAAIADVTTAIPRGLAGAYNSTIVRGMRAAGLPAAYLPDIAGGDYSSATPFYDKYAREQQGETPAPRPMSEAETARLQEANAAPSGVGIAAPRPPSAPRRQPAASPAAAPAAPMLPDTRESTVVNPSEAALQYAQLQGGLKELFERQNKPRERTPEELKEAAAREEEIRRRMGEIDASKARFEQAKQERVAGQKGQGLRDLASFLARARGPSVFSALGEAQIGMEPILAARAAQEQKFREQELMFMDKLGERRDLVNDIRLASLKDDAGRAREDAARLRALDMEISKLGLGLGEKRAGELAIAEREREKTAATAKEGALNRATQIQVARIGQEGRAAGAGLAEQRLALQAMRADPNYAAIVKELTEAKKLAGVSSSPTLQNRLRAAEKAARDLAAAYGVTPGIMGMGGEEAPAPAAGAATRMRFDAQGNPIK